MVLTADQLLKLRRIHTIVHNAFVYRHDDVKWGRPEYWVDVKDILSMSLTGHYEGDCDDFALIMRHECRQNDIPSRLVFCWVPSAGGYHLVLEADGWVSDCNHPQLMERDLLDYEWIGISGFERGEPWTYLKDFDSSQLWPHERTV